MPFPVDGPSACACGRPTSTRRRNRLRASPWPSGQGSTKPVTRNGARRRATALSVEPRDGRLCVFMPPVETADDYVELLAVVGACRARSRPAAAHRGLSRRRRIRGSNVIRVAPDPGVIEVNIQPASSWEECVAITTGIYEDARQTRLGADKFMLDGRHTGTGGGNHIVIGGRTPLDSPFLRRPDLLEEPAAALAKAPQPVVSLFRPVHRSHEPGAAHRRGAARQPLRTRNRAEPDPGTRTPVRGAAPWLLDRLLRNALIDVTGNTHRAEICIDKLFSPDGPTGRLGLVEFRAFEMPPDPRMSLAQQLLMRALIARFWEAPAERPAGALGHRPARPLHAAAFRVAAISSTCSGILSAARHQHGSGLVRGAGGVPLPVLRRSHLRRT